MYLSPAVRRNNQPPSGGSGKATIIAATVAAVVVLLGLALGFYLLREYRRKHKDPKYIPTPFLKNAWRKWEPGTKHHRIPESDHVEETLSVPGSRRSTHPPSNVASVVPDAVHLAGGAAANQEVDRRTSVRSVMTLPAYHPNPLHNEQVLGREGERGGVDVVIEFPEGPDEEEANREAEMEALYQVRLARRRENEEREERRRLRREARERGDSVALRELETRSRAQSSASSRPTVEEARAEHERIKKERQRAISSVSYADLGIARHDGTRLRANSNDSEREGLLADAASMGGSRYHQRGRSGSSVLSIETTYTDLPSGRLGHSRTNSARSERPETPLRQISSHERAGSSSREGRAGSSPEIIGSEDIPLDSPPGYENVSLNTPHDSQNMEPPPVYSHSIASSTEHDPPIETASFVPATTRPPSVTVDSEGRRISARHVGQMILERIPSNSSNSGTPRPHHTGEGESRSPQLQTLGLSSLPSIHVDPGSPGTHPEQHPGT